MTRPLLPAYFIVVGKDERLVIVADAIEGRARRDFGREREN